MVTSTLGTRLSDLARGLDTVEHGQRILVDSHVGFGGDGLGMASSRLVRLGDHAPPRLIFKDAPDARAHHIMVIGNQYAGHGKPRYAWLIRLRYR